MDTAPNATPCRCLQGRQCHRPWIQYQDRLLASAYNVDRATGVCREPIAMGIEPLMLSEQAPCRCLKLDRAT